MSEPKVVMIVDDDANSRAVLCDVLEGEPYTLLEAEDGERALELANKELPDLILLDVLMPDMDGLAVLHKLKQQENTRSIPVIMVTALHMDAQVSLCLDGGAIDHISKPFSSLVVRARVRAALRSRTHPAGDKPLGANQGRVLGFIGVKGGVGTTTVAVNVALTLLKEKKLVAMAELRPYPGTLAAQLGLSASANLDLLLRHEHPGDINLRALSRSLTGHRTGLRVLLAPPDMDEEREITAQQAEEMVTGLASMVDYVVVDFPANPSKGTKAALRCCQSVVLVVDPESTCLAAASAMLKALESWGVDGTSVGAVLVHRVPDTSSTTDDHVRSQLACPVIGVIPPAPDLCERALQSGSPLVLSHPDCPCATAIGELAGRLAAEKSQALTH